MRHKSNSVCLFASRGSIRQREESSSITTSIHHFRTPKQLVAYVGLNPRVQLSGQGGYVGSVGRHGRKETARHAD